MFKTIAIAAGLALALSAAAEAQTPAQGRHHPEDGPLWVEFRQHGHPDDHARPGRDLVKAMHRSLYNWDPAEDRPVPELANEVNVSPVAASIRTSCATMPISITAAR